MHSQARRILRPFIFVRKTFHFAAGRKFNSVSSLKPSAYALAIASIMGLFLMGTAGSASAQDTTPPKVPSEFTVTLKSEAGPEPTPPDGVLSACVEANEGFYANLSCPGDKTITRIDFAGYGQPAGSCREGYSAGSCQAADSRSIVEAACLNRSECAVSAGNSVFGDPCPGIPKRIAIAYTCSGGGGDPYPTQFWNFPPADHSVEQIWAELPNRMFTDIENFQGNQDPPFTWQTHTPGPFLELTDAGLELSWDPNADKSAFPAWLQRRSELTEPFTTSVVPGTTSVFAMRFEVNNLPGPLTGPVTIFQRFRDDLDRPDLDVELARLGQFPDAEPNSVLVHAAGDTWKRPNLFLKGPGKTNDLVVAIENKEGGAYKVSLNGKTLAQGTGNFAPATPTTFTAPKFGIYNHGGHQEYFKFTHKTYGRYTYNRTPDFNLINSVNITQQPTCSDGVRNQDETGVDCGGSCPACNPYDYCTTNPGRADDSGLKQWCWHDMTMPAAFYSNHNTGIGYDLVADVECNEEQLWFDDNSIHFRLEATNPAPDSWCGNDFNMRSEVRTMPWVVQNPIGTEEWFGWRYTFPADYVIDRNNQWAMFQIHPSEVANVGGLSPQFNINIVKDDQYSASTAGEIYTSVAPQDPSTRNQRTHITPLAGDSLDFVVYVKWGLAGSGLLKVWINDVLVRNDSGLANVYEHSQWGGNAKWGIYKHPWRSESAVNESIAQGVPHLELIMGPLRQITRFPDDPDYGRNEYDTVKPQGQVKYTSTGSLYESCYDGIQNGDEAGTDCGGSCPACPPE